MGGFWHQITFPLYTCPWIDCFFGFKNVLHSSCILCLHRLRHCFVIRGERQGNSLGHMAVVPRSYRRTWRSLSPARCDRWTYHVNPRTVCGASVWSNKWYHNDQWLLETIVHSEVQNTGESNTYEGSTTATCETAHLSSHLMDTDPVCWPQAPNNGNRSCKKDFVSGWQPFWTTLPEASQSCYELIRCGCLKGCRGRCKCKKVELKSTVLCGCDGDCTDWK